MSNVREPFQFAIPSSSSSSSQRTKAASTSKDAIADLCYGCGNLTVLEHLTGEDGDDEFTSRYVPIKRYPNDDDDDDDDDDENAHKSTACLGDNNINENKSVATQPQQKQHVGIMGNYGGFVVAGKVHL